MIRISDAFKIFPYYPEILMIPLFDDLTGKFSMMIVERLPDNREGRTLYSLNKAIYDNEDQAVFHTTRSIQNAMSAVKVMMN